MGLLKADDICLVRRLTWEVGAWGILRYIYGRRESDDAYLYELDI